MTKLLIADDEPLVQIGVKSMLNWNEYGIEVCGTAMNGARALELIEEYSPGIVITDIRMPMMNGLELAKICREKYGKIPLFIFLTSYEEFRLIKEAMAYEAIDYLIKLELNAAALAQAVKKALARLESLQAALKEKASGRPLLQGYYDKFILRLLHNLFDTEEQFRLQAKDLKLTFTDSCYCAALLEIHEDLLTSMDHAKLMKLCSGTFSIARDILSKYIPCYAVSLDMKHFAVIFHVEKSGNLSTSLLNEAVKNAVEMVHNYFNVSLFAGIGIPVEQPLKICESYQDARQAFGMARACRPIVLFTQDDTQSVKNAFNITVFKNDITKAFDEFDTDVLRRTLSEIIELFRTHPLCFLQAADAACSILYLALSLLPDGEENMMEIFSSYSDGYRSIYRFTGVDRIIEWMTTLRDGLCQILKSKRKTYKAHVVTNVQKYINSHITERLSLNEVADIFGLSPNYLSILFKKNCHIGFSEYISHVKIAKAKNMLLERDVKIYEAADRLGFESAFYFSKVFKKVEGISPREYIQQNTVGPDGEKGDLI